jgi:signal peptidase I
MNDDRDTWGQELSTSDGRTRPGQVDGQQMGGIPADGAAPDAETAASGGQSQAIWHGSSGPAFDGGAVGNGAPNMAYEPPTVAGDGAGGIGAPGDTGLAPGPARPRGNAADEPPRGRRRKRRPNMSWWVELPILLVFALVLALLIKSFVVQAFFIPSSSMENTLEIGDKVLVNKLVYDFRPIHRGDVIVFNGDGSWDPIPVQPAPLLSRLWDSISGLFGTAPGVHDYIKRVIGIPGDHVACCNKQGDVTVNGIALHEKSYLYPGDPPSLQRFSITVQPGRLWVMGDHRSVSWDSRGHMSDPGDGTIPVNHVVGRAFVIVAPISRWRILPIPATFEQPKLNASGTAALGGPSVLHDSGTALLGALALPGAPAAAGVIGALPLTLLQRRLRRRLGRRLRRPSGRRRLRRPSGRRRDPRRPAGPSSSSLGRPSRSGLGGRSGLGQEDRSRPGPDNGTGRGPE